MTERMNIRRVQSLDRERKSLPFDPERDLTDQDWKMMRDQLAHIRKKRRGASWSEYVELGSYMKILNATEKVNFPRGGTAQQSLRMRLEDDKNDKNWVAFVEDAGSAKIIDPQFFIRTNKEDRQAITRLWQQHLTDVTYWPALARAHVIYPAGRIPLSRPELEKLRSSIDSQLSPEEVPALRLADLRLICPEYFTPPSADAWAGMRRTLGELRTAAAVSGLREEEDIQTFARMAAAMNLLAVERVEVTDNGLKLIRTSDEADVQESAPMPPGLEL